MILFAKELEMMVSKGTHRVIKILIIIKVAKLLTILQLRNLRFRWAENHQTPYP